MYSFSNRLKFKKPHNFSTQSIDELSYTINHSKTKEGRLFVTYSPKSRSVKQHIIFVHGEWFGKWFWDNFSDFFVTNGYECTTFDIRGHGEDKSVIESFNIDHYVEDLHDVATDLNLREQPIMIGHGLGSNVILRYLNKEFQPTNSKENIKTPQQEESKDTKEENKVTKQSNTPVDASSVILISPYTVGKERIPPHHLKLLTTTKGAWRKFFFSMQDLFIIVDAKMAKQVLFSPDSSDEFIESCYQKFSKEPLGLMLDYYQHKFLKSGEKFRLRDIMIISALNDELIPKTHTDQVATSLGIESQVVCVEGPHALPLIEGRWQECASTILDHLNRVGSIDANTNQILESIAKAKKVKVEEIINSNFESDSDGEIIYKIKHYNLSVEGQTVPVTHFRPSRRNGKVILFVHGEWTGSWIWEQNFMGFFANLGYDCYSLDIFTPNTSNSDEESNSLSAIHKRIEGVINGLGIASPIFMGHGLGCSYILSFLSQKPEFKNDMTILLAPAPLPIDLNAILSFSYTLLTRSSMREKISFWFSSSYFPVTEKSAKKFLFADTITPNDLSKYLGMMKPASLALYSSWKAVKYEKGLKKKPLIVTGNLDKMVTEASLDAFKNYFDLPDSNFISTPDVSHMLMLDSKWYLVAQSLVKEMEKNNLS